MSFSSSSNLIQAKFAWIFILAIFIPFSTILSQTNSQIEVSSSIFDNVGSSTGAIFTYGKMYDHHFDLRFTQAMTSDIDVVIGAGFSTDQFMHKFVNFVRLSDVEYVQRSYTMTNEQSNWAFFAGTYWKQFQNRNRWFPKIYTAFQFVYRSKSLISESFINAGEEGNLLFEANMLQVYPRRITPFALLGIRYDLKISSRISVPIEIGKRLNLYKALRTSDVTYQEANDPRIYFANITKSGEANFARIGLAFHF